MKGGSVNFLCVDQKTYFTDEFRQEICTPIGQTLTRGVVTTNNFVNKQVNNNRRVDSRCCKALGLIC